MISNIVSIKLMRDRNRWDFASYHPNYETALGVIRSSKWKVYKLGELAEYFKYGASIPADYVEEGILFLRAQNIRESGIDLADTCYIDGKAYDLTRYILAAGDIIITRSGINVGEAAVITPEIAGSAHGSYSIRLRISNSEVSPEYVAWSINSPLVKAQIMALKSRSAQPNINISELSSLQIIVPPIEYQARVVQIMKTAYEVRRQKLIEADEVVDKAKLEVEKIMLGEIPDEKRQ